MHEKCPTTHLQRLICIAAKCWLLSLASFSEQSTAPQAFLQASCVIFTSCSTCCNLFASAACFRAFCKDFTHGQVQDPQLLGACRMAESISPAMKAAVLLIIAPRELGMECLGELDGSITDTGTPLGLKVAQQSGNVLPQSGDINLLQGEFLQLLQDVHLNLAWGETVAWCSCMKLPNPPLKSTGMLNKL